MNCFSSGSSLFAKVFVSRYQEQPNCDNILYISYCSIRYMCSLLCSETLDAIYQYLQELADKMLINIYGLYSCNSYILLFTNKTYIMLTVVPTESDSEALFCLQLLSKTLTPLELTGIDRSLVH